MDYIARAKPAQTMAIAMRLACQLDSDAVQDMFQSEMACDGYFIQKTVRMLCGILEEKPDDAKT